MKLHNMAHVSSMTLLGTIKLFKVIFRLSKISKKRQILQNRSHGFDRGEQNSQNFENFISKLIILNFGRISYAWEKPSDKYSVNTDILLWYFQIILS